MKKNINILAKSFALMLAFVFIATSCSNEDLKLIESNNFIQVTSERGSLTEDVSEIKTTVAFAGESNPNGITVNFSVTSSDPSRYTVEPSTGIVEIPAGDLTADIIIKPVDNILVDGDIDVKIELLDTNSVPVGLAGEGVNFTSRTITIIDNDCPIVFEEMVGTYTGSDNWYSSAGGPLDVKMTTSYDGTSFKISGLGHAWLENPDFWAEEVTATGEITIDINTITGEFDIPYTYTATTLYAGAPYDYYVRGKGKYLACSKTFEIEFELFYPGEDPVAPYFGVPGFVWKETLVVQ